MKYFFTKLRAHSRRIGAIVTVFGITALVLAYFLGFYDISFLDRAEILGSIGTPSSPAENGNRKSLRCRNAAGDAPCGNPAPGNGRRR